MKRVPGHPLAPPSGVVAEARIVLYEKIGDGDHACNWCGKTIRWMPGGGLHPDALIADHLNWDIHNNTAANLVPSCNRCNAHRTRTGDKRLISDSDVVVTNANGSKTRAVERPCRICATPFLARLSEIRIGKGRYCSRSCARRGPRAPRH